MKRILALLIAVLVIFPSQAFATETTDFEEFIRSGEFGIDVTGEERDEDTRYEGEHELTSDSNINIKFKDAMITDILSVMAKHIKKNIFFIEEPIITSFEMFDIAPMTALEALLSREGLSYIERDGILIVGEPSRLEDTFFDRLSLYEVKLNYISASDFNEYLDTLGVTIDRIVIERNQKSMYVRGLPQDLTLLRDIKEALDKSANVTSTISMERIDLEYISPAYLTELLSGLDFEIDVLQPERGRNVVWLRGTVAEIEEIKEFIGFVDDPANMEESLPLQRLDLLYINTDILLDIVEQANLELDIFTVGHNQQAVWVQGPQSQLEQLENIVNQIDVLDNRYVTKEFDVFAYQLDNVVPRDVMERIEEWEFEDLKIIGYNFTEFGNDILVLTPPAQKTAVIQALNALDGNRRTVKIPVMSSEGTHPEDVLEEWRSLLGDLLHERGIREHTFTIMPYDLLGGMGKIDEETGIRVTKKTMYAETTPDRVQLIMDMLDHLNAADSLSANKPPEPSDEDGGSDGNGGNGSDRDDDSVSETRHDTTVTVSDIETVSIDGLSPSEGNQFVKFHLRVRNNTRSAMNTSRGNVTVIDNNGHAYQYDMEATTEYGGAFEEKRITNGFSSNGNIVFEIPDNRTIERIHYRRAGNTIEVLVP